MGWFAPSFLLSKRIMPSTSPSQLAALLADCLSPLAIVYKATTFCMLIVNTNVSNRVKQVLTGSHDLKLDQVS